MRILAFGDSIAYGAWDSEGGWADRLKRDFHKITLDTNNNYKFQFLNLGIGGETSSTLLKRLKNELESRKSSDWPFVLVFAIGINDTRIPNGEIDSEISLETYKDNISKVLEIAREHTDRILIIGFTQLSEETIKFKEVVYSNSIIKKYDEVLESVCTEEKINFVSLIKKINNPDLIAKDGLHPNDKGHERICDIVREPLLELIGIE